MSEKHSFWSTMPGILTGIAAIITALGGLLLILFQTGFLGENSDTRVNNQMPSNGQPTENVTKGSVSGAPIKIPAAPKHFQTKKINLLSSENGGQLLVADSNYWLETIDGDEGKFNFYSGEAEAVFGFKDEQPATFDTFTTLVEGTDGYNLKKFELLVGNESPTGQFVSIGKFETQNVKLFKTPYQEFKFQPVTAKFLKVKLLSTHGEAYIYAREFQLMGNY